MFVNKLFFFNNNKFETTLSTLSKIVIYFNIKYSFLSERYTLSLIGFK